MTQALAETGMKIEESPGTLTNGLSEAVARPTNKPQVPAATAPVYTWADKDNWHDIPKSGSFWIVVDGYLSGEPEIYEVERDSDGAYVSVADGEDRWSALEINGWALDRKQAVMIAALATVGGV